MTVISDDLAALLRLVRRPLLAGQDAAADVAETAADACPHDAADVLCVGCDLLAHAADAVRAVARLADAVDRALLAGPHPAAGRGR